MNKLFYKDDQMEANRKKIIELFMDNVKGKRPEVTGNRHHGSHGHWLEKQMGIKPNSSNSTDILGYEMKTDTTSKTSFGDWSPDKSLWGRYRSEPTIKKLNRDKEFLAAFGHANPNKNGRYSWSGMPVPKVKQFNRFGQKLIVTPGQDIQAIYSKSADMRINKSEIVPKELQKESLLIAQWTKAKIKPKLERKFNQNGWFKCILNESGVFHEIVFGEPMSYENWLNLVREGYVFFDSGMYEGNRRPYAHWRASNNLWNELVVARYS